MNSWMDKVVRVVAGAGSTVTMKPPQPYSRYLII